MVPENQQQVMCSYVFYTRFYDTIDVLELRRQVDKGLDKNLLQNVIFFIVNVYL